WVDFIELQSSNPFSPLVFKTALKQPFLQKYLLPIQRLDYLFWYVENYLYHNEDYREAIQQLECPTTFFIGRNSTLYPETGQTLIAQSVEHAKAIYFERSGHTPLLTEPKKFGHEITTFLSELKHAS
ncbi:MAG: alpha/beta fold hydrolase, partial [Acinetobacter calcoaceticus]